MFSILSRLFGNLIVGACFFSLIFCLLSLGVLLRLFPKLLRALRFVLRGFLILSYRLYALILNCLSPFLRRYLAIGVLAGIGRVAATLLLSLGLGWILAALIHFNISGWFLALLILHGLFVGLVWEEIARPGGFQLGARIE